ncbi:hypothetical protein ACF1AY_38690 [Streptomyces sp. NPDC014776]|uniref:hypothetical protein n=1 Tax=unclassified Streptomyces TaxID=2593676 RepID=UPI0036F95273
MILAVSAGVAVVRYRRGWLSPAIIRSLAGGEYVGSNSLMVRVQPGAARVHSDVAT